MKKYTFLGRSDGVRFCIEGLDVFAYKWQSLGECDIVLDPIDKKPYSFSFYRIKTETKELVFLAGKQGNTEGKDYQDGFYFFHILSSQPANIAIFS